MPKQVWICETCQRLWQDRDAAKDCESRHSKLDELSIKSAIYRPNDWTRSSMKDIPDEIIIEIHRRKGPLDGWNYVTYKIDHVGPKGC